MKNKIIAGLLGIFLGGIGFHKFYLGKWIQGILYILFCATFIPLIIGFLEGVLYLLNSQEDFDIKYNAEYVKNKVIIDQNK